MCGIGHDYLLRGHRGVIPYDVDRDGGGRVELEQNVAVEHEPGFMVIHRVKT